MTREIALDTETTGLSPKQGDRVVEIACVEMINHVETGRTYHQYINPERDMPAGAFAVHGLSEAFLSGHPVFCDIADDFLEFIGEDPLVIHNASFDMGFLNHELGLIQKPVIEQSRAIDTLLMARKKFPGSRASLDALCKRFSIDNSKRDKHGALIDTQLLAQVYVELLGGRQPDFDLSAKKTEQNKVVEIQKIEKVFREARSFPLTQDEEKAHTQLIDQLENALWGSKKKA